MITENEEIIKMLGWKLIKFNNYFHWEKPNGIKIATFKTIHFDTDANLQMEVINFIEALGFNFKINRSWISIEPTFDSVKFGHFESVIGHSDRGGPFTKSFAIYQMLYNFAQYYNINK